MTGTCKTFLYYFCHRPAFAWFPPWARADHATEVYLLLDVGRGSVKHSAEDEILAERMISYWVNFAKTG
jgi:carboxylesterase type B